MRTLLLVSFLAAASPAFGQRVTPPAEPAGACWPTSHIDKVVVQLNDGTTRRGSLLCLGSLDFAVAMKDGVTRYPLADVRQIRKAADSVWDGAAKGAATVLIPLILSRGHCPAGILLQTALGYGAFGLAIDAIDTHMDVIYRPSAGKRIAVGFRLPL
jgi:hypothetical protein